MNQPDLFDLTGRVAVITGGGGLLASEHAIALNAFGAKAVLADINIEGCEACVDKLEANGITAVAKCNFT